MVFLPKNTGPETITVNNITNAIKIMSCCMLEKSISGKNVNS